MDFDQHCINCGNVFERRTKGYMRTPVGSKIGKTSMTYETVLKTELHVDMPPRKTGPFLCTRCASFLGPLAAHRRAQRGFEESTRPGSYLHGKLSRVRTPAQTPGCVKRFQKPPPPPWKKKPPQVLKSTQQRKALHYFSIHKYATALRQLYVCSKAFRKQLIKFIEQQVRLESANICRPNAPSILRSLNSREQLEKFSWKAVIAEAELRAPVLLSTLKGASTTKKGANNLTAGKCSTMHSVIPVIGTTLGVLMFTRNPINMKVVQEMNSIQLWLGGCNCEVFKRLNHLGLCLSIGATRSIIDRMLVAENRDVDQWKACMDILATENDLQVPSDVEMGEVPEHEVPSDVETEEVPARVDVEQGPRISIQREILENADLSNLSSKKVRRMLEDVFDTDLVDRKKEIDGLVMEMVEVVQKKAAQKKEKNSHKNDRRKSKESHSDEEEEEVHHEEEENGSEEESDREQQDDGSSEELSDDEPPPKKVRPQKKPKPKPKPKPKSVATVKRVPENLSDDESEDECVRGAGDKLNDEELAKKLQEEENGLRTRHRSAKKPPKPLKEAKPRKKGVCKGNSPYSRACVLSPELATVMGTDRMARNEVVKRMWQIVKERKLEDPKNKQFMLCDEELFRVFGKKRVRTFGMMKVLKNHIKDLKDITISIDS
ncbi:hypothetical protein ScPMuIL_000200 [Solemya velum]